MPANRLDHLYAHPVVEDRYGVIAPWHPGQNGPIDERMNIALQVYKRYPWVGTDKAVMAAPDFVYNSHWSIKDDGTILIPPTNDWMCGDLVQRAWSTVKGLTAYYQYTGDPVAFLYIPLTVDYVLDYGLTSKNDLWPEFPISTPTRGKAYGKCDPSGRNQLDTCAIMGTEVLRAYKLTCNPRYLKMAKHWGDVFAAKCNLDPQSPPWNRYVDPSVVGWSDVLTGTTTIICEFLDDLIDVGYKGQNNAIVKARDAGRRYVREELLPIWTQNDVWGRNYWDWDNPVMCGIVSMCGDYIMKHPEAFPSWKTDLRNILCLIFNRNGADPNSMGDTYSGAWAFPESCTCCGTSLSYNQYTAGPTLVRFGVLADDARIREIGRRMLTMASYDSLPNGVVKDGLLGRQVATGEWSNLAHPWPLCQAMEALSWLPEEFGPNRENHVMRSTSVVNDVQYEKGKVVYTTFDAKKGVTEVIRLAFRPTSVKAGGKALKERERLDAPGYTVKMLKNGDAMVTVRHDGAKHVAIEGDDPQAATAASAFAFDGSWDDKHETEQAGATATIRFEGNQVRLLGAVGPEGGWADVTIDGQKEPTIVEFWNPTKKARQHVFRKSGLANGPHELKLIARGEKNPISKGRTVSVEGLQSSAATGSAGFGEGGGPTEAQRMIFGFTKRQDYVDVRGNSWRPATEFVIRTGYGTDTVEKAWWTHRRSMYIGGTPDEEVYRYGVHGKSFWVNLTVGPGEYAVRLHFAETPLHPFLEADKEGKPITHTMSVAINGQSVMKDVNIATEAGGTFRAYSRTFSGIRPRNGIVEVRLTGSGDGEAILQALELLPVGK